jgi:hypothetical protein
MDYAAELAKARKALAGTSPGEGERRSRVQEPEDKAAFDFLDRLRRFLLASGAPGREKIRFERAERDLREQEERLGWRLATLRVGDQRDEGDTVLVLFSDRTEVAEAEYFREFESCTVRWNRGPGPGPPGRLSPRVIEGVAGFLQAHRLDWDGG